MNSLSEYHLTEFTIVIFILCLMLIVIWDNI